MSTEAENIVGVELSAQIKGWARAEMTSTNLMENLQPMVTVRFPTVEAFVLCRRTLYTIIADAILQPEELEIWYNADQDSEEATLQV